MNACLTCDEQLVYLIGGRNSRKYAQTYDQRTGKWQAIARTSGIYELGACCAGKGKIHVSGGLRRFTMETYDPIAGKWDELRYSPMIESCFGNQMISLDEDNCLIISAQAKSYEDLLCWNASNDCHILSPSLREAVLLNSPPCLANLNNSFIISVVNMAAYKPCGY